jgi:hypothetical protein
MFSLQCPNAGHAVQCLDNPEVEWRFEIELTVEEMLSTAMFLIGTGSAKHLIVG